MKRLIFIKAFVFIILTSQVNSQNNVLSVTGHVFDIETSLPVNNQNVVLNVTGNGMTNTFEFYSDEEGFWGSDSLLAYNQGTVQAITYDCNGEIQEFLENYFPGSTTFVFDFYICQDSVPGGDCTNWFTYEQTSLYTFNFHGESLPTPADIYAWNFGDGMTDLGQDIIHTFDPGLGYQFNVQLTTFIFDPATGDSCIATSDQWVFLNDTLQCEADFYYFQDTLQPLTVHFFDNSIGNIISRLWDFGDGITSSEINPVHTYDEQGEYYVCLTIYGDSLGNYCTDTLCTYISIQEQLQAAFNFTLDTLSGMVRQYYFTDASTGTPETWQWYFGDDTFSNVQNPVHQFAYSGSFDVCLQVTKTLPNGGTISDEFCHGIMVPAYYDLGGLAFIGNTPINNPISTGDTGIAYLYRKYNDQVVPVDTNLFYEFGYYWFSEVREGDHIVKVGLTENSEHFASFAPAYYPDHLYWEDAEILQVTDTNNYFADIHLPELPGVPAGTGMIYGYIVDMQNPSLSDYIVDQPVFICNSADDVLAYCISSYFGNFAFENVVFGTYKLYTDVTGFYGEPITITVDQANPAFYNAILEIYESPPYDIPENNLTGFRTGPVYPNPLTDQLNLEVVVDKDLLLNASIYNLIGQKVFEDQLLMFTGKTTLTLSTDRLDRGLYFITIRSDEVSTQKTYKFLKK